MKRGTAWNHSMVVVAALAAGIGLSAAALADETCNSPYMSNLIKGQEGFVHVWTLGVTGLGDGSDKLVTIDADPKSAHYGKVIDTLSVGGQGEAHHMGFTDDRKYLWAGNLDDSKIFVFDVGTNPAHPKLVRTIGDLSRKTSYVGPHTFYALPGRMLIGALSNTKDGTGVTGMALYNNQGVLIRKYDMPLTEIGGVKGDGYGYDVAVNPAKNVLLTSSFTGRNNYMRDLGAVVSDPEAMRHFGNTMVVWNLKSMQPTQVLNVPGAPLEIRWGLAAGQNWAVTATALTSKIWLIKQNAAGSWEAKDVASIGDPSKTPLPVDISITADGKGLWVNTFMDGTTHYFDLSNPEAPRETYQKHTGSQVNMVSQSWDGRRVYITSSLLSHWDKAGKDNEQVLRAYNWDGRALTQAFEVDFTKEKLGRPHHMKFSARPVQQLALSESPPRN